MLHIVQRCIDTEDVGTGWQGFKTDNSLGFENFGKGNGVVAKVATDIENCEIFWQVSS